jgi:2-dehydro-3-deoxyphosphogluconate aldolase/(4S)-4-hydroxy-2-oxoglutarate aldolase
VSAEEHVRQGRLVAIIRAPRLTAASAAAVTQTLVDCGVRALEFTLNSDGALDAIRTAREVAGERAAVGAGTVLSEDDVLRAAEAGAQFVVSPDVAPEVIGRTVDLGLLSLPGAFTPTEVRRALDWGADMVKLFPAQPAGVSYLASLLGPMRDVAFVPTGGIGVDDVPSFLEAGAAAVALGSALVRSVEDLTGLRERAQQAVAAASSVG